MIIALIVLLIIGSVAHVLAISENVSEKNGWLPVNTQDCGAWLSSEAAAAEAASLLGSTRRQLGEREGELLLLALCAFLFSAGLLINGKSLRSSFFERLFFRYHRTILQIAFPVGEHAPPVRILECG